MAAGPSKTTFTAPAAVPACAIDSAAMYSSSGKRWVTTPSTGKLESLNHSRIVPKVRLPSGSRPYEAAPRTVSSRAQISDHSIS